MNPGLMVRPKSHPALMPSIQCIICQKMILCFFSVIPQRLQHPLQLFHRLQPHGARKLNRGLLSWLQLLVDWCSWCWFAPLSPAVAGGGRRKKVRNGVHRLYPAMVHVVHVMKRLLPELYHLCQTISQRHVGKMLVNSATLQCALLEWRESLISNHLANKENVRLPIGTSRGRYEITDNHVYVFDHWTS